MKAQRMSPKGIAHLKYFEGFKEDAYQDIGGVWTIGWGHTEGVKPGDRVDLAEAEAMARADVRTAENCVNRGVDVDLTQKQFDALVSLVYNIGCGAFQRSTLLRKLNAGDHLGASDEFLRWNKVQGRTIRGLSRRREAEQKMFLHGLV